MVYDPTIYAGAAEHYARGRPPYSRELVTTLAAEVSLDGSGRMLDVGCGPGILAMEFAHLFEQVVGLDPDSDMLGEGARRAASQGISGIVWVRARAEEVPTLQLGTFKLVTFGQSFHWTDRERVAEAIYDLLDPGGVLALVVHTHEGRSQPTGPGYPPIPHDAIRALIDRYVGASRRAGQGFSSMRDRYEDALTRTRFGKPIHFFAPGRVDIIQDVDGVLSKYLSTSFGAPHLFGRQLEAFKADVRIELARHSGSGLFWDWPGDTEIVLARKSRADPEP